MSEITKAMENLHKIWGGGAESLSKSRGFQSANSAILLQKCPKFRRLIKCRPMRRVFQATHILLRKFQFQYSNIYR